MLPRMEGGVIEPSLVVLAKKYNAEWQGRNPTAGGPLGQPKWTQKSSLSEAGTLVLEWEALEEALRRHSQEDFAGGDDFTADEKTLDADKLAQCNG